MNRIKLKFKSVALMLLLLSSVCPFISCGGDDSDGNSNTGYNSEIASTLIGYKTCPDNNHPHWIDLGIGTLWCCCNAGASTPEEYGGYYTFDQAQAYNPPSVEQIEALVSNCSYTWTTQNGVAGGKFTGPNGGTIFLPAAGLRWDDGYRVGSYGYYWSSTTMHGGGEGGAYFLHFYSGKAHGSSDDRNRKQSVRPVR